VICSFGLEKGVERITKWMMLSLLFLLVILAGNSFFLEGGAEGLKFYLLPDVDRMMEAGISETITAAMNQSFFSLSLGIGAMLIFGSYLNREKALLGECVRIAFLDTFVAFVSGLVIFPACFAYGVNPDSGPDLIFMTLPNVFNHMAGGRIWGTMFFLFMFFASFSTIIAVFENILACVMELTGMSRRKASVVGGIAIALLSIPCILGFNKWAFIQPLGAGSSILDFEDFLVSNLILPFGCVLYLLFCVSRVGWGFNKYLAEANTGDGVKIPKWMRFYMTYILPIFVIFLFVQGLI